MMKKIFTLIAVFFLLVNCTPKNKQSAFAVSKGSTVMTIFDWEPVFFNPDIVPNGCYEKDSLIKLGNGRIILKKINVPEYERNVSVTLTIKLKSAGDPWDKSGSCFIIPKDSLINFLTIAKEQHSFPEIDSEKYENFVGIVPGKDYLPVVEAMRFMTPFGVGFFSNDTTNKPVYVDSWEEQVEWSEDITQLYSLLKGETYIGIWVDTWTKEGYKVSADINITESTAAGDTIRNEKVLPLMNTVYYLGQKIPDIFCRKTVSVPFTIPRGAKNVRLHYITTGHGGHSGGDEFVKRENSISIDEKEVHRFTPWKNYCAAYRRFNPSSGVWMQKRTAKVFSESGQRIEKEIEEPLASSDLSRSNWCPGSDVPPVIIPLNIDSGQHKLSVSIPGAQPLYEDKYNHWLVSAYLVYEY
ncbi:PNGase F N-terminal domain-containing protein [Treponema phagedenis]|uniref:N-glycanase n=1 Tax=Treponema phagedenis TaxID=162 RepID=A0AAE6IWY1_TREPH|nr:PNGase F N-terminal domain-containing protein [Treponema phagedenis]QEJ94519.1 N-glycanase [Treponema phagedenis]QEJ98772.1 N-glycanase [Treponema phagedenis]QEK04277.1 N-glycanase [Treponema phagedenis]QEK09931.1 N-glycanase [Treponema phagedenis]QSH95948.1 N-glycanase [Treponema phagedenis]